MSKSTCTVDGCASLVYRREWCNGHYKRWLRHGDPEAGRTPRGALKAFVESAATSATDECIEWPYATTVHGYGVVWWGGRMRHAHRVTLELVAGPPPESGMEAAHAPLACHNRACVNPRHLRWATRDENVADRALDGTNTQGTTNGSVKLTEAQVLAIFRDPRPKSVIADGFGVTKSHVYSIKRGRSWAWLTEPERDLRGRA